MSTYACYKKGYKYQLAESYSANVGITPERDITTAYIRLTKKGILHIRDGYAWDGPSGPTIDTSDFMRGSLEHDALYQLMREGELDPNIYRVQADDRLKQVCLEDGMWPIRAWWVHRAVRRLAFFAADPKNKKKIYIAPT